MIDHDGTSWLLRSVAALREGGCHEVYVVLGAEATQARVLLADDTHVVVAEHWREGQSASLRAGLHALPAIVDAALVSLVDLPDVDAEVVARVLTAGTDSSVLARATYDGRPGHPVLLGRSHWDDIANSVSGDEGARDYLATHDVELVECGDLATGRDIDEPATDQRGQG